MDKGMIVAIAVVLAVLLGLPLIAQLAKKDSGAPATATAEAAPAAPAAPPPPPPSIKPQPIITTPKAGQTPPGFPQLPGGQNMQNMKLPENVQQVAPNQFKMKEIPNAAAPQLNAQNLVGSVWGMQGGSIELLPGGMAIARHPQLPPQMQAQGLPGQWSVNGSWIRLSAMGFTLEAQIVGKKIMGPDGPVPRIR
ncbi:MAG: hypothetical protein QG656_2155 [Candidatus Hydrogenedentes bacterium]|nr:hypothetical protein [Candidatus Hydrogenedentota bacterium]